MALTFLASVSFEEGSSLSPKRGDGREVCFWFARSVRTEVLPQFVEVGCADSARSASTRSAELGIYPEAGIAEHEVTYLNFR